MSDVVELVGFGCLAAAAFLFAGVAACLLVAGVSLLFVSYTLDGPNLQTTFGGWAKTVTARRAQRRQRKAQRRKAV